MVAWHDDDGLAELHRGYDRPHACMTDHQIARALQFAKLIMRNMGEALHRGGAKSSRAYLSDNIVSPIRGRPLIDRADQAIKRQLGSDGNQYHRTCPRYRSDRSRCARCAHCTTRTSATGRTRRPDSDMRSLFAMLSIQIVRAPNNFATSSASAPGAAPVDTTRSGANDRMIWASRMRVGATPTSESRAVSGISSTARAPSGGVMPDDVLTNWQSMPMKASHKR